MNVNDKYFIDPTEQIKLYKEKIKREKEAKKNSDSEDDGDARRAAERLERQRYYDIER